MQQIAQQEQNHTNLLNTYQKAQKQTNYYKNQLKTIAYYQQLEQQQKKPPPMTKD
jgi:hypothetical protein